MSRGMRVRLYQDLSVEVTQQELDIALEKAHAQLPSDSTLVAAVTGQILRNMHARGELSRATRS